jgi:hypothetical protein
MYKAQRVEYEDLLLQEEIKTSQLEKTYKRISQKLTNLHEFFRQVPEFLNGDIDESSLTKKVKFKTFKKRVYSKEQESEADEEERKEIKHHHVPEKIAEIQDKKTEKLIEAEEEKMPSQSYNKSTYIVDEKLVEEKILLFMKMVEDSEWNSHSEKDGVTIGTYESNDNYTGMTGSVVCHGSFEPLMEITGNLY